MERKEEIGTCQSLFFILEECLQANRVGVSLIDYANLPK